MIRRISRFQWYRFHGKIWAETGGMQGGSKRHGGDTLRRCLSYTWHRDMVAMASEALSRREQVLGGLAGGVKANLGEVA